MSDSTVRPTPAVPRSVDYLLAAMGIVLFGGVAAGVVAPVPLPLAAGVGSVLSACLLAIGLLRYPQ
ncbi:hypothetical protein [Haloplanus halobius]|uniref:hypothetical protein n=1 Tax=Haloplanus halobius TaxID=2934938 RepID=UPI00200E855F|nr:hypothetical protein [Haloplanus sp. XH21]